MAFQKDAKKVLANERTFLEWTGMSVLLGGIGTSLLAFSYSGDLSMDHEMDKAIAQSSELVGSMMLPVAVIFAVYSLWLYSFRDGKLNEQLAAYEKGTFEAGVMPTVLTFIVIGMLITIALLDIIGVHA